LDNPRILDKMRLDKKTVGGSLRFVLPSRMGAVELVAGVPPELVAAVLDESR
jgi:3-dehydroquinate synthase